MTLISKEYLALNAELHNRNAKYGGKGDAWKDRVLGYMEAVQAESYMDYGCGKMNLLHDIMEALPSVQCLGYDPVTAFISEEDLAKIKVDFLTCNDVLEHIEPKYLDDVLKSIAGCIEKQGLLVISQRLANKKLKDGRNAHLIVEKTDWWIKRLKPFFREIIEVEPIKAKRRGVELAVLVKPWRDSQEIEHVELLDPKRPLPA